jgi:hypothetical protein
VTEPDLDRIERALGLRLPEAYRQRVVPFPVPPEAGNSTSPVWDDAGRLIALNQRLRVEVEGWPRWLFAIGQSEGDPCGYAIDTRSAECPVWWLEQMQLGSHSGPSEGPFDTWFVQWVADSG